MSADSEVDSDELDPDEPRTPLWLTLLGGGLFLLALLLFLLMRTDAETETETETETEAAEAPGTNTEAAAEPPGAQPEGDTEDHTDHGH